MDLHEECRRVHRLGVLLREKMPYANAAIPFTLVPYRNGDNLPPLILTNGIDDHIRALLKYAAGDVFRAGGISAAVIQSDTTMANMDAIHTYFKMSAELSQEQITDEYQRILRDKYDGIMANLPRELWYDAIMTAVKGPGVLPLVISSKYHGDEAGQVVWDESVETTATMMTMLPDWWEETVQ